MIVMDSFSGSCSPTFFFGILDPEEEGIAIYRKVGTHLPIYTA
jgi:hypothetical protein